MPEATQDGQDMPGVRLMVVYGALRSGTTLLRLMINEHPNLKCPGESDFVFDYLDIDPLGRVTLDYQALQRDRIFQAGPGTVKNFSDSRKTLDHMLERLAGNPSESNDITLVLMLHRGIEKALKLFPELPVIHMLRDPRDVARSSIGMGWAGTASFGIDHWIETETEWDCVASDIAPNRQFELRYERLVAHPEDVLQELCAFATIAFEPRMLTYDRHTPYNRPDASLAEQWKHKLSVRDIALVEGRLGTKLAAKGYEPSGHTPVIPGKFYRIWLSLRNKRSVWQMRISRYGLMDPVLVALAGRLRLPQLGYRAQERINAKVAKSLK